MTLLMGGGSLALATDTFANGEPTSIRVRDILTTPVLEPIPPPIPGPNNVESINFFGVAAGGFVLNRNLPVVNKTLFVGQNAAQLRVLQSRIIIRASDGQWLVVQPFVRTAQGWTTLPVRIWTGSSWQLG
jgi:hypothetical protein